MSRNYEYSDASRSYGRNVTVTSMSVNGATTTCSSERMGTKIIKGNGSINSTGVIPDGSTCSLINNQTEVEFTLDIYKKGDTYQGNLYIVSYDTRKKINSNRLVFFQQIEDAEALCIFCVKTQNCRTTCRYELLVSVSPTNCANGTAGSFFAYSAPIYNEGVNLGGNLSSGEIIFYDNSCHDGCRCGQNECED